MYLTRITANLWMAVLTSAAFARNIDARSGARSQQYVFKQDYRDFFDGRPERMRLSPATLMHAPGREQTIFIEINANFSIAAPNGFG